MAVLVLRTVKGSPLTHIELDNNFLNLDAEIHQNMGDISLMKGDIANLIALSLTAGATAPALPIQGTQWFDTTTSTLYVFDGAKWVNVGDAGVSSATAPVGPNTAGDTWFDNSTNSYKVYDGSTWKVLGSVASTGATYVGTPVAGSMWYNTTTQTLQVYDGTAWVDASSATYSSTVAPTNPKQGTLWFDTATETLKVYNGTVWTDSGETMPTGNVAPVNASQGDLWYDTTSGLVMVYDGAVWKASGGVTFSAISPTSPSNGAQWFDTATDTLYTWNGSTWIDAGSTTQFGTTAARPATGTTGDLYFNTTAGLLQLWDGSAWVTAGASKIDDLSDVDTTTAPTSGQTLLWDGVSQWKPGNIIAKSISTVAPAVPVLGDVYFDTTTRSLMAYDGAKWLDTGSTTATGPTGSEPTPVTVGDQYFDTTTNKLMVHNGTSWVASGAQALDDLTDVDTTGKAAGEAIVWNGTNWISAAIAANAPTGATGSEPATPVAGDLFYNTTTDTLMVYDAGVWVPSSVVNDASLTLQVGAAGATNTTVTVGTGTGFTTNAATNATYSVSVGPALTEVATELAAGKSATGILTVTGVDTLGQLADGTVGQVLSTDGVGTLLWNTPVTTLESLTDVITAGVTTGNALVFNGTNWIPDNIPANTPVGAAEPAASISTSGDLFYNTTTDTLMVFDGTAWVPSVVVNNASLTLQVGAAGATNTTVTVATGTGFTANTATNATYSVAVGPALTEVATELAAGKVATGLLAVTGVDTLGQLADGTTGQVLKTDGAGTISWTTPVTNLDSLTDVDLTTAAVTGQALVFNGTNFVASNIAANAPTGATGTEPTTPANGDLFYNTTTDTLMVWDSGAWVPSIKDTFVDSFAWTGATGQLKITLNDVGTTTDMVVNLDGRYAQKVNGILPDATGNIAVALTEVETGLESGRTTRTGTLTAADEGLIWVVSGETGVDADKNGLTYIWDGAAWQIIVGYEQSSLDARYVLKTTSSIDELIDVDTTTNLPASGQSLVWDGTSKWVPGDIIANAPSGATGSEPLSPANGDLFYNTTTNTLMVYDSGAWKPSAVVNDAALTLQVGAAGATGTSVTVATGTGFTANATASAIYSVAVGPALTEVTAELAAGKSGVGLLTVAGVDTLGQLADGTVGQVLKTDGAGTLGWTTPTTTLDSLTDVDTTSQANGTSLVYNGTNWIAKDLTPAGATGLEPASPLMGDQFYNTTLGALTVWNGSSWVQSSVVNNASLTLQVGAAGATNTTVTVATGTGFTANSSANATYAVSVGPALTEVAAELSTGKSATGILTVTGVDTLGQLADGTSGQVLSTNGAGVVSWTTPTAAVAVTYSMVAPVGTAVVGSEHYITSDGTRTGTISTRYIYDSTGWTLIPSATGGTTVAVTYSNAAPTGAAVVGSEHYVTSDGTRTGTISSRYIYDAAGWTLTPAGGAQYIDELLDVDTTGKVDGVSLLMWDATKVTGGVTGQWVITSVLDGSPTAGSSDDF